MVDEAEYTEHSLEEILGEGEGVGRRQVVEAGKGQEWSCRRAAGSWTSKEPADLAKSAPGALFNDPVYRSVTLTNIVHNPLHDKLALHRHSLHDSLHEMLAPHRSILTLEFN